MDRGGCQGDIGHILTFRCQIEGERGPLRLYGRDHRWNAHDVHDAGHVVGKDMKRHLRRHLFQSSHFEVRRPHPRFDGAVGMLDGHAAHRQLGWIFVQAFLDAIKYILLDPPTHAAVFARRAFGFDHAISARA